MDDITDFNEKVQEWRSRIREGKDLSKEEMREYIEETRARRQKTKPVAGGSKIRARKAAPDVGSMLDELDGLAGL